MPASDERPVNAARCERRFRLGFQPRQISRFLATLLFGAVVLLLVAWQRGAEFDEQYTLFLTSGVPRPAWPASIFPAGLASELQSGDASLAGIARDLRVTDVHPPLYFWLVALSRRVFGHGLFEARLLSVACGVGALALTGAIAFRSRIDPVPAMLFTLGCYGFAYTSAVARGFALAQLLVLVGVVVLLTATRARGWAMAGILFGAATMANYLAAFTALACVLAGCVFAIRDAATTGREARAGAVWRSLALIGGVLLFVPAELWWFLAQRASRTGQFPPFSLVRGGVRLAARFAGDLLGGLPLYVTGPASVIVATLMGLLLLALGLTIAMRWRRIGDPHVRAMFALAALAPPIGLLALGAIFNNTPIEVRYLTFSTPFVGLLLAGASRWSLGAVLLAVQAASIAGLILAPETMQPARATARAAAALIGDGVVLLPRGNDGVGIVGAFAIEAPPSLPLLLVPAGATPEQILARTAQLHRVVLALVEQDEASLAATAAMRLAFTAPEWLEVARGPNLAVYERAGVE